MRRDRARTGSGGRRLSQRFGGVAVSAGLLAASLTLPTLAGAGGAPAPPPPVTFLKEPADFDGSWVGKPGDFNGDGRDDVLW